jgi:RNA polymerase sigma factor (TIGR02999 family)
MESDLTALLVLWGRGDREALNRLFPLVYDRMRGLARGALARSGREQTLSTTALVHEAYLRLVDQSRASVKDRNHFFTLSAKAMRHILVDHARRRLAGKRGGTRPHLSLEEQDIPVEQAAADIVSVHEALEHLESLEAPLARLVELRFFGGLSVEEAADVLEVSTRTIKRDWRKARAFLYHRMMSAQEPP